MKVLLSIKPEFAKKIFEGEKKYEFRRTLFKNKEIKEVVVYASSPVQKVIGKFEIDKILSESIDDLWEETKFSSGIEESYYRKYFEGKENGFAIKIKKATMFKKEFDIQEKYGMKPPQSFAYIKK